MEMENFLSEKKIKTLKITTVPHILSTIVAFLKYNSLFPVNNIPIMLPIPVTQYYSSNP